MARNPFLWWLPEGEDKPAGTAKPDRNAATAPKKRAKANSTAGARPDAPSARAKTAADARSGKRKVAPVASAGTSGTSTRTVPAVADAGIEQMPGHLIRRAQQIAVASFLEECDELTPVQFAALSAIATNPGVDATRVAGLIALDRTTISGVLERLESKGLIARAANAADRRAKLLEISASGRKLLRKTGPGVIAAQERMLAPLSIQERGQLVALLTKLVDLNNDASRAPRRMPQGE